ncbi:hypothetical protein [Bacillus sp. FJAT-45350]|uniref:hypothetical protein n=1 Tax=Bacillus sp. FJAT-45350 TaxID=2011014 RepID=UPI000BB8F65F|nr:hypothetical protein [Bacillus sp. FJAT-45350]
MKQMKQQLLRAKNIPEFKIVIKEIDEDVVLNKEFKEGSLKPYIKTGVRLHENTIELPIWDDENLFKEFIPPWGFHKFCDFQKSEFGLGLIHIQFRYGKKIRKKSDYRFREEKDVEKIDFYFLYDFHKEHYLEVKPENSEEWQRRVSEMEVIENQTFTFVWDYLVNKRSTFIENNEKFKKSNRKTYLDIKNHLLLLEVFLEDTWLYFDLLFIVYGDLTQEEHFYLEQAIRRQKKLITNSIDYIQQFNDDQLFDAYDDYANRKDNKSAFGIISETFFMIDTLLKARKEKIESDEWFVYNPTQGFLHMDKKSKKLYPNFAEVERRRSLYQQAANSESEKTLHIEIFNRQK